MESAGYFLDTWKVATRGLGPANSTAQAQILQRVEINDGVIMQTLLLRKTGVAQ